MTIQFQAKYNTTKINLNNGKGYQRGERDRLTTTNDEQNKDLCVVVELDTG